MIENFTKEELETIRAELKELPTGRMKGTLCAEERKQLYIRFYQDAPDRSGLPSYRDITDALYLITDMTLQNVEQRTAWSWKRRSFVPPEMLKEYEEMVRELVDVIEKHFTDPEDAHGAEE